MNFKLLSGVRTTTFALLVVIATVAFAGCGGGGSSGGGTLLGCLSYGGGGGGGGAGGGGSCNPNPSPTVDPSAQPVAILLTGENPVSDPTYGMVLGYSNGMNPSTPNGSSVVHLTANQAVQFGNVEATGTGVAHTASSLGPWSGSYPAAGPTSAQQTASASGSSIGAAGFSSGTLNPGKVSKVFNSGASGGIYIFGCFFHYNSNNMRTVVIVM